MVNFEKYLFVCFAAEDRYKIVEPVIYHLDNYGIKTWYDRYELLMGDNRQEKNLIEGAGKCGFSMPIISNSTKFSSCAMEEISIIQSRYRKNQVVVFPVLYDISPNDLPSELCWVKELIFKETTPNSGTREICNHVACKMTAILLEKYNLKSVEDISVLSPSSLPPAFAEIMKSYSGVESSNLNSRISLLYAAYLLIKNFKDIRPTDDIHMVTKIFQRTYSEMQLNLEINYRDLWLLENCLCILVNSYLDS